MNKKPSRDKMNFLTLFPEIREIQDPSLRGGVLRVWEKALQESGVDSLSSVPFNPEVKGVTLIEHIQFVVKMALFMAERLEKSHLFSINRDLLIASALLHDLGKIFEYGRQGKRFKKTLIGDYFPHGFWGAFLALREGLSLELAHLISSHPFHSSVHPKFLEGIILHYADFVHADSLRFSQGLETFLEKSIS